MRGLTVTGERGIMNHRQVALTKAVVSGVMRRPYSGNRALTMLDLPASQPDLNRVFCIIGAMATGEDIPSCARQEQPVCNGLKRGAMPIIIRGTRLSYLPTCETGRLGLPSPRDGQRAISSPGYCLSLTEEDDRSSVCRETRHQSGISNGSDKAIVRLHHTRASDTRGQGC